MRAKGWERVQYVRYQTAEQSQKTYKNTQELRVWGVSGDAAVKMQEDKVNAIKDDYTGLNQ